ncbi:Tartrate-resistant acid phosphatase type 5 [Trichostrongylus colubriformis]|uniref:Tartrate-resistant acid phosphatase type 5 n=1 Tax=Trichostrongylus colubriformis TaxID=6319 RepID=A0AAN8FUH9_TRICO
MHRSYVALVALAMFGMVLVGTFTSNFVEVDSEPLHKHVTENRSTDSLRILLVGDTGGLPIYPYVTYAQKKVAKAMTNVAIEKATSFEDIYDTDALNVPWYLIAGNHDHFGNVSAQIAYTKYSRKWNFPDLYYKVSFQLKNTTVDVLMLDTIVLCGNTADIQNGGFFDMLWNRSHDPEGPTDVAQAEKQWKWIVENLNTSRADYLFVAGHYPIHSVSSHGPTQCLQERLDPMLVRFNVSAYFAGHDHILQHVVYPGRGNHQIHYVLSGAASRSDRSKKHLYTVKAENLKFRYPTSWWNPLSQLGFSNGGFVLMDITPQQTQLIFYNGKGDMKYRSSIDPRLVS